MRLIECYIENFGIYHEYQTKFDRGLDCRVSENGSGKTTLTAFILAMLYGMPDTRKQSLSENERKKYSPWQGGAFGGSLTLEVNGKLYTVERFFGSKPSDDSFTLRDTLRGTVSEDFSERIGEELFGIDRDGFLRTVYLSEKNLSLQNENKSISAKLSDLVGVDGDVGGFDDAIALLDDRRKFYYKKSGRCEISNTRMALADKRAELDGINGRLSGASERAEALALASARRQTLEDERRALGEELVKTTEENRIKLNYERYSELLAKYESYERKKKELLEFFGGNIPTAKEIDEMRFAKLESERIEREEAIDEGGNDNSKYSSLSFEAIASLDRAAAELSSLDEDITRLGAEVEEEKAKLTEKKRISAKSVFTLSLGACLTLLGIILGFSEPILFLVAIIGAITLTFGTVMAISDKSNRENGGASAEAALKLAVAEERAAKIRAMLYGFCREFGESDEDVQASLTKIKEGYTRYYTENLSRASGREGREIRLASARSQKERVAEFLSRYEISAPDPFLYLSERVSEWSVTCTEYEKARCDCERFRQENDIGIGREISAVKDGAELGVIITQKEEELKEAREEYARQRRLAESDSADLERRDELTAEIALLEDKLEEYIKTLEVIQGAMHYLEKAVGDMTARYIGKTEESFKKYERALGGSGGSFAVGTDFTVTKNEHGAARSEESYSRGTKDLLALSMRLALIDSLYENESPFIILDDPLIALDDARIKDGAKLLRELSKERQILYFTCSKSREI